MAEDQKPIPQGGVTIAAPGGPPVPPPEPAPAPSGAAEAPPPAAPQMVPETVVVPTGAKMQSPSAAPPIPPTVLPPNASPQQSQAPTHQGGSFFGTLLKFLLLVVFLGGLGVAGWFGWKYYQNQQPVTIVYWGLWENEAVIKPLIDEFEKQHPTIIVQYEKQSYQQYRQRLVARIENGEGPDVYRFHSTWLPMLTTVITPVPQDVMSVSEFDSTFYAVMKNDLVAGSTIYGIPLEFDGLGLYINEDLFSAAGASAPSTWEDVYALVPRLTAPLPDQRVNGEITTSAIALGTTNNVENFSDILALMFMQNGVKMTDPTGKEAEEAMIFYRKFADPADPLYTWNSSFDNSISAFANGRVAMIFAPSWRAFDIKQMSPGLHFKIVPVPQLPGNTVNWASYWVEGVSSRSKYPKQAWEFVKFLTGKEAASELYSQEAKIRLFGEPYARKDLADTVASDPYVSAYITEAESARSFPLASRTWDEGLNDQMIKYLEDAVNSIAGGTAPAEALRTMSAGFRQVLGKYGLVSQTAPATP